MGDDSGDQNGALMSDPVDVIIEKLLRYVETQLRVAFFPHTVELSSFMRMPQAVTRSETPCLIGQSDSTRIGFAFAYMPLKYCS